MLIGLLGHPLTHSLSPLMQNKALQTLDIKGDYRLFDVEEKELRSCVSGLKSLGCLGFNVTIPYKRRIIDLLDEITPQAAEIGAVNLVKLSRGKFVGDNSDAPGFVRSLKEAGFDPKAKKTTLIVGCGGAARAVAVGLKDSGCQIYVTSRQKPRSLFWAQFEWLELKKDLVVKVDLVVDCTPVGMYPDVDATPVLDPRLYGPETVFCDLVYNPRKTTLIRIAKATKHKVITGDGMLLHQGAISFESWFSVKAPIIEMQKVLDEYLKGGSLGD